MKSTGAICCVCVWRDVSLAPDATETLPAYGPIRAVSKLMEEAGGSWLIGEMA